MAFWNRILKQPKRVGFVNSVSPWGIPPERNTRGYLSAYSEIYSLFGITLRIATAVSEVKWRLYKGNERSERSQVAEHPILTLLDYANAFQTGQEVLELLELHLDLAGRAYWYLPKNGLGVPGEIWVLPPHLITIVPSKEEFIAGYIYNIGDEKIPLGIDEIIRFSMPDPLNLYGGIGFTQAASIELDSEVYSGKWNRNFFYNSARPDAALEFEGELSEEQFKLLKEQWASRHQGLSSAHKLAILQGGIKYKQIQIAQKDMDFQALRKQTRENLLFAFGMPLSVMGIVENVNRANAEAGDYTFARWLVKPRLTRIRNKLNEQLVSKFPLAKGVELDFDEVVPETVEQKRLLAESGLRAGYKTINDARKLVGDDPLPPEIGDMLLIPLNLIPTPTGSKRIKRVKSIFPNEEHREAFWKAYITKVGNYERHLVKSLQGMFALQEEDALKRLGGKPSRDTVLIDRAEAKAQFTERVSPILADLIQHSVDDATGLVNPEPHKIIMKQGQIEASQWLKTRIGWAADEVGEETAKLLSTALVAGFDAGEDIPTIARRVRDVFEFCDRSRALRISRTETIMASNEGALYGYEESGVVKEAEFYTAEDERTCEECMGIHGQVFPIDDAHGMIPLHPQCRCVWLPVV